MRKFLILESKEIYVLMLIFSSMSLCAQKGVSFTGNTHVHSEAEIHIGSYAVYNEGITTTDRSDSHGTVSLGEGVSNGNETPSGYVDGYLRTYTSGEWKYQVGSGEIYAPVLLHLESQLPVDAAYNAEGFQSSEIDEEFLDIVSDKEHWDVLSENKGKITLYWEAHSDLNSMLTELQDLTIAGWNGEKWTLISSVINENSNLESGSIASESSQDFSVYSAFTFAKLAEEDMGTGDVKISEAYMFFKNNKFLMWSSEQIESVQIFNLEGKLIASYIPKQIKFESSFPYPNGVYLVKSILNNGKVVTRKLIHR